MSNSSPVSSTHLSEHAHPTGGAEPDWAGWAAAWERHMTGYLPTRDTTLDLLADLVAELVGHDAEVVELGAGVGGLAERLLDRLATGHVTALEFDPLLRRIGMERTNSRAERVSWCSADLRDPSWHHQVPSRSDAIVTALTLHCIGAEPTRQIYRRAAEMLPSGGVLVNLDFADVANGDHVANAISALAARRNDRGATTAFHTLREDLAADPVLGPLADARDRLFRTEERLAAGDEDPPYLDLDEHRRELTACGFRQVEVPWRELDLSMLVAIR